MKERKAYRATLEEADPDWPSDVQVAIKDLNEHLFEADLRVREVRERCGLYNNNITTRFGYYVGMGMKDYIVHHRLKLGKLLLRRTDVPIKYVALAVGYKSPSSFSTTFKRWVGCPPGAFREILRNS